MVAWVCQQSEHEKLMEYLVMQCIKDASTLRVSQKGDKLSPRIVYARAPPTTSHKLSLSHSLSPLLHPHNFRKRVDERANSIKYNI